MALVNIPRDVKDDFHRYKMPALIAKVEGRGNGIKTVIVNMNDIAKALDRPPEYVTKFFGFELGALTTIDPAKDRYIVNGKHDQPKLAQALDGFIERFILCKKCVRNPETKMITKAGNIELQCKACGNRSPVDMRHKLAGYIIKNPPSDLPSQKDKKKKEKEVKKSKSKDHGENGDAEDNGTNGDEQPVKSSKKKKKGEDDDDDDEGVEWFTDTSKEATEERRRQMLDNTSELAAKLLSSGPIAKDRKNPLDVLQKFIADTNPSNEQIIEEAKKIKEEDKFDDEQIASLTFVALFDKDILKHLKSKMPVIHEFIKNASAQKGLLIGIEELCGVREQSLLKSVPHILKALYDEDILEEEAICKWFDAASKGTVAQVKASAKVFVEWLRSAEEESEEEEEEGNEEAEEEEDEDDD